MTDEELKQTIEKLETLVREARGIQKDLTKDTNEVRKLVAEQMRTYVDERIDAILIPRIDEMGKMIKKKMDESVAHTSEEFNKVQEAFLGGNGKPSLLDLAEQTRSRVETQIKNDPLFAGVYAALLEELEG